MPEDLLAVGRVPRQNLNGRIRIDWAREIAYLSIDLDRQGVSGESLADRGCHITASSAGGIFPLGTVRKRERDGFLGLGGGHTTIHQPAMAFVVVAVVREVAFISRIFNGYTSTIGMVGDTGIEPVTSCMSSKHSNHLS